MVGHGGRRIGGIEETEDCEREKLRERERERNERGQRGRKSPPFKREREGEYLTQAWMENKKKMDLRAFVLILINLSPENDLGKKTE